MKKLHFHFCDKNEVQKRLLLLVVWLCMLFVMDICMQPYLFAMQPYKPMQSTSAWLGSSQAHYSGNSGNSGNSCNSGNLGNGSFSCLQSQKSVKSYGASNYLNQNDVWHRKATLQYKRSSVNGNRSRGTCSSIASFYGTHTQNLQNQPIKLSAPSSYNNLTYNSSSVSTATYSGHQRSTYPSVSLYNDLQHCSLGYAQAREYMLCSEGEAWQMNKRYLSVIGDDEDGNDSNAEKDNIWGSWLLAYYKWLAVQNGDSESNYEIYKGDYSRLQEWWETVFNKNGDMPDIFSDFKLWVTPIGNQLILLVFIALYAVMIVIKRLYNNSSQV